MTQLSIVIPVYNEEKRIPDTLKKIIEFFKNQKINYEILVVNDGSKDKTVEVCKPYENERIKVIDYKPNQGKGYAVRKGMLNAGGDIAVFSDADLSTPIEEIDKFLPYFKQGFDIVIGSRALKESNIKIHQPVYREWMGRVFNLFVQRFAIKGIKDTQCGFKAFTQNAAKKVFGLQQLNRFSFDVEALYIANKLGFRIKEVPVTWINDEASKVSAIKDSIKMFKDILKIKKLHKNI